ncbi:MAG: hypothetical protein ACFCVD_01250 [Nodosilinea sp.]
MRLTERLRFGHWRLGYQLLTPTGIGRLALNGLWGWLLVVLVSCEPPAPHYPRYIVLQQSWELEPGDWVAGHLITASLGDISVRVGGSRLIAPFAGEVQVAAQGVRCIYFSAPDVPAYLFRYCGVTQPQLGWLEAGQTMARGKLVHFATLRRQPDGAWAIVEPSDHVLEKSLQPITPGHR